MHTENKNNNCKGITIISLVITIIILLILASVTISELVKNGLFEKVKSSKEKYLNEQEKENDMLKEYENLIDQYEGTENLPKTIFADMVSFNPENSSWKVDNVKEALDYLYNN